MIITIVFLLGVVIGFVLGLPLAVVIFSLIIRDGNIRASYDSIHGGFQP